MEVEGPKKTIIYLDQFVVSGIVKALDPEFPRRERLDPFWLDLYKKLDRLLRLQLIVCPDSIFHQTESLLSGDSSFEAHQDVYGYLSNGCTFYDEMSILRWQIHAHFRDYLEGNPSREPSLDPEEVVYGDLNEWQNKIQVTVPHRFIATEQAAKAKKLLELAEKYALGTLTQEQYDRLVALYNRISLTETLQPVPFAAIKAEKAPFVLPDFKILVQGANEELLLNMEQRELDLMKEKP